jgi:DNA-binding MarR family transcriptional regulator
MADDAPLPRPTPTPLAVIDLLATVDGSVRRRFDDVLGQWHGLNRMDLRFLRLLRDAPDGRLPRAELAAALSVSPSVAARRLGPMERMGLVTRTERDAAAGQVELTLTEAGQELADNADRTARELAADLLETRYTLDDLDTLVELLGRLDPDLQI